MIEKGLTPFFSILFGGSNSQLDMVVNGECTASNVGKVENKLNWINTKLKLTTEILGRKPNRKIYSTFITAIH